MPLKSPWTDQPKSGYWPTRYFIKFALLEHYLDKNSCLKEYDTVAWIDSDCIVSRYDLPLSTWLGDVVTAWDVNALHPTVIIVRNSLLTRGLMWACNSAGRTLFATHDWSDNLCLRFFSATPPYDKLMRYYSAKELCAMPPGVYPIPPDIRSQYEWDETSWSLHLSALTLEARIKMATAFVDDHKLL